MAKPPHYRIFIKEGAETYLFCRLWQQKSDESLMIFIYPRKGGTGGTLGKVKIESNPFDIYFDQVSTPANFEHTTIHASGQSHTKLKDGSLSVHHDKLSPGIPLKGLKTSKHLSTLLCRDMDDGDKQIITRQGDIPIERDISQKFTTMDILAIPKSINIKFSGNWEMENDRPVTLSINLHRLLFNSFDVLIFTRHSDQFDNAPPKTIQLPDMNSVVPMVTKIDNEKLTVSLSKLNFDQVLVDQDSTDPYYGFNVITAIPKYL